MSLDSTFIAMFIDLRTAPSYSGFRQITACTAAPSRAGSRARRMENADEPAAKRAKIFSTTFSPSPDLESLRSQQAAFAEARDWDQFHTPRNLALAM